MAPNMAISGTFLSNGNTVPDHGTPAVGLPSNPIDPDPVFGLMQAWERENSLAPGWVITPESNRLQCVGRQKTKALPLFGSALVLFQMVSR